ncbi:MAG: energy-coupling factor transporter transmembrane component T [Anaerolineae bacterium]|jgi:energy-coupling factor transport system permease protein
MSQKFDLYVAGASWLHRLDPRAKLCAVVLAGAVGLMFKHLVVLAGLLMLTQLILRSARIPTARIGWLWARLAPLLTIILILQPIFAPGPGPDLLRLGPVRLTSAGLLEGVSFALRAAALTFVAAILLLTTDPTRLVQGLVKLGLPYPWGLTVDLAIRYLPTTYSLFLTVHEAQQARGWIVNRGNLFQRARSYVPILVATIIAALRLSDNLGLALAARGLGYPVHRTAWREIHFSRADWLAVALAAAAFGGMIALRYGVGFGAGAW